MSTPSSAPEIAAPATGPSTGTARVKRGMAEMLKGGVIMDVVTPEGTDRRHIRIPFTAPPATLRLVVARLGEALAQST